ICFVFGFIALWLGCGGEPPAPQTCPNQISAHRTCVNDSDCRSGLCDRGTCGDPYGKGNYGRECISGPSGPRDEYEVGSPFRDIRVPPFGQNRCSGFLCIDGRCRSCQSDAECQWEGSGGPKCLHYQGWPGKRCGNIADMKEQTIPSIPTLPPVYGE